MGKPFKPADQDGEISFQFVKISLKGSDPTMQEALKTITATLVGAGMQQLPPSRQVKGPSAKQVANGTNGAEPEAEDVEFFETREQEQEAPAPAAQRKPAEKRKPANYKVIGGIKIDDVKPTLVEFTTKYPGETTLDKYLVIAYWFKHTKSIEDLTVEHFFTAYKLLGWIPPGDPGQAVRDLRNGKRQWLVCGKTAGTSTINNVGEGIVLKLAEAA